MSELVNDDWRALDDTLADGPAPADVPPEAARWLAEQRAMHGLLRALHTADAAARESRVERIMAGVDAAEVAGNRRHWGIVGVAAALLAGFVIFFALPDQLPTAEAAVDRIVAELGRDVDRRYRVMTRVVARGELQANHNFVLVTRPGSRFRIDGRFTFGGERRVPLRIGSDGNEVWILPGNGKLRQVLPLREQGRLRQKLDGVLDLVDVDVHSLLSRLPKQFRVEVVGRERKNGVDLVRLEARRQIGARGSRLRSMWLLYDERTGLVRHFGLRTGGNRGVLRVLRFDYLGEEPSGLVDYDRPW